MTTKSYANATNKNLEAVIKGLYKFKAEADALSRLTELENKFLTASPRGEIPPKPCVFLWIEQYEVTEAEAAEGAIGNYGLISVTQRADGIYTLTIAKVETPAKNHPRRRRKAQNAPNWGHPILRSIKKKRHYATLEAAQNELDRLHLEFPKTTIPNENKLYLMIFSREIDPKQPLQKYVLQIENVHGGGFTIDCRLNAPKPKRSTQSPILAATGDTAQAPSTPGHFASLVSAKRKRKPAIIPKPQASEG